MNEPVTRDGSTPATCSPIFATTRWTLVLAAGDDASAPGREALDELCRAYWFPLYAYIRRRGHDAHAAEDLTQGFFARLLERNDLARLTREGGKFRSFLLTALNHFLANEYERNQALKRGGGQTPLSLDDEDAEARYLREPAHVESPDRLYERQWAVALMESALDRLAEEQAAAGRADRVRRAAVLPQPRAGARGVRSPWPRGSVWLPARWRSRCIGCANATGSSSVPASPTPWTAHSKWRPRCAICCRP